MSRAWPVVLCVLVLFVLPAGQPTRADTPVIVRTQLDPRDGVVIGQPVRLLVEVLFPDAMPRPPRVSVGDAPGAQILRFETQGVTIRDRVGEQDYVGQRFEFVVFPRRGGTIDLPGAEVTLLDASGDVVGAMAGEVQHLAIALPRGIDASQPVIATNNLTITQSWSPEPARAHFKPGDALVRTIRRQASGMPAMGMADFVFSAPGGVRVYVDPPKADDRTNRGEVVGSRLDKVTYVFEQPGAYDLPDLKQIWWNLDNHTAHTETLRGARIDAVSASSLDATERAKALSDVPTWLGVLLLVLASLGAVLVAFRQSIAALSHELLANHQLSERSARLELNRIAPSGNAIATYDALSAWLSRLPESARRASLSVSQLQSARSAIDRVLFGRGGAWSPADGKALRSVIAAFRRDANNAAATNHASVLPPLNPPEKPT